MQVITSEIATKIKSSCPRIAERVVAYVLENFAEEIRLEDLAGEAGLSRFNFCRKFHRECGVSPMRWLWNFRTILAAEFIALDPRWSLTDIAFSCGFTSSAHFSRSFRAMYQQSPSAYKKAAQLTTPKLPVGVERIERVERAGFDSLFSDNAGVVLKAATKAMAI
jgi:AraC-like DNA-binding protein